MLYKSGGHWPTRWSWQADKAAIDSSCARNYVPHLHAINREQMKEAAAVNMPVLKLVTNFQSS